MALVNTNTHKGKYKVKNPDKYAGDPEKVYFRSSWERAAFVWCEKNPNILKWSSEEIVVPYASMIDNQMHRYFVDLYLEMKDGKKYLIEIKPGHQTKPPLKTKGKRRSKLIEESLTFVKNQEKWNAAERFCKAKGYVFQVWTEDTLKKIGIKII